MWERALGGYAQYSLLDERSHIAYYTVRGSSVYLMHGAAGRTSLR